MTRNSLIFRTTFTCRVILSISLLTRMFESSSPVAPQKFNIDTKNGHIFQAVSSPFPRASFWGPERRFCKIMGGKIMLHDWKFSGGIPPQLRYLISVRKSYQQKKGSRNSALMMELVYSPICAFEDARPMLSTDQHPRAVNKNNP